VEKETFIIESSNSACSIVCGFIVYSLLYESGGNPQQTGNESMPTIIINDTIFFY